MSWATPPLHLERQVAFEPITAAFLDRIAEVDQSAYAHPWSRRHFADSLAAGHALQMLVMAPDPGRDPPHWAHAPALPDGRWLLGYLVAMKGVDEVHLLNITTVPLHQRQGWARCMLQALTVWSRGQGAQAIWLEVRTSHRAARTLYEATGFAAVGVRKGYYPDHDARREDAIVMRLGLDALH
jgi:ribosomal-protein-alanine N-acetyltransferase